MKIYYYCSYDGSPAGFHLGSVDYPNENSGLIELNSEDNSSFIRNCFESGFVRSAFGKIPSTEAKQGFFLLKKKMRGQKDGENYYLGIAIVNEEWEDFLKLVENRADEEEIVAKILDSIEKDKGSQFGYRIDTEKLAEVARGAYGDLCNCKKNFIDQAEKGKFFTFLSTDTPDIPTLRKSLELSEFINGKSYGFTHENEKNVYSYGKKALTGKNHRNLLPVVAAVAVVAVVAISIAFLMSKNLSN